MKSKQEVIQEAWGKYWGQVKDHVDENGKLKYFHCWQIFGDGVKSDRNFYDHELQDKSLNLQNCDWDMAYYPKAIEGLSNNNGWTRIESEADLPKEAGSYWVIRSHGDDVGIAYFDMGFTNYDGYRVTHWQPIIKPEAPIY